MLIAEFNVVLIALTTLDVEPLKFDIKLLIEIFDKVLNSFGRLFILLAFIFFISAVIFVSFFILVRTTSNDLLDTLDNELLATDDKELQKLLRFLPILPNWLEVAKYPNTSLESYNIFAKDIIFFPAFVTLSI